ncbi:MAG: ISL3 family transposase [Thermomicrobiales bacterium]
MGAPEGGDADDKLPLVARRGQHYHAISIVKEYHTVDLLPDRTTDAFATWLVGHPGVEVVSRDRSGEYAEAVRQGAPRAVQVADRFHLLRNLRDVALRVFKRHAQRIGQLVAPGTSQATLTRLRLDRETSRERTREEMHERFIAIHRLAAQGMNRSAIARHLGVHRHTVQKYLASDRPLDRRHCSRKTSMLTPYEAYILAQWRAGRHNAMQLWREIVARGYAGSYRNVSRLTGDLRKQERGGGLTPPAPVGLTPAQAAGILLIRPENRTAAEQETLAQLPALHPEITAVVTGWESFACLLRDRHDPHPEYRLERWLAEAGGAKVPELKSFATKLRQDLAAVTGALTSPHSQGQTEGRVNQLKRVKRSMYGRAKFALLRQRVLYTSTF